MTTIGPAGDLAAYFRAQLAAVRPAPPAAGDGRTVGVAGSRAQPAGAQRAEAQPSAQREDFAGMLARRVAAIDRQDPDRRRKAFRVFLESLMLDEWGAHLINDPGFQQVVDSVQQQMQTQPGLGPLIDEAARRLLDAPGQVPASGSVR